MSGERKYTVEHGKCSICGSESDFQIREGCSLREARCPVCSGSKGNRDLASVVLKTFVGAHNGSIAEALDRLKELSIYEAQAIGPIHEHLKTLPRYVCSDYLEEADRTPTSASKVPQEDLRNLSFADDRFDLVLTQDVLEHISDPEQAFLEIRRVLKPGGVHIFTVPLHEGRKTVTRARREGGTDSFLLPEVYHGDPLRKKGSLVYTDFGEDLPEQLASFGMRTEIALHERFYPEETIPNIRDDASHRHYQESVRRAGPQRYFLYNSVVFKSTKERKALQWTGERYIPSTGLPTLAYEHLHRYRFAGQWVKEKEVLDLGCGEGYGCFMLSEEAAKVVGIDIDDETVRHASSAYVRENLHYLKGSMTQVPLAGEALFDVITCFEAIEHIAEHGALLREVKRLLRKDGIFLVSTPNKTIYSDEAEHENRFHVKELYFSEFSGLLSEHFKNRLVYGQSLYSCSNLFPLEGVSPNWREFVVGAGQERFEFLSPEDKKATYYIAVASDGPLCLQESPGSSYLIDASDTYNRMRDEQISKLKRAVQKRQETINEKEARLAEMNEALTEKENRLRESSALYADVSRSMNRIKRALPSLEGLLEGLKGIDLPSRLSIKAGEVCAGLGLYEGAESFYGHGLRRGPDDVQPPVDLGTVGLQPGDPGGVQRPPVRHGGVDPSKERGGASRNSIGRKACGPYGGNGGGVECPICEGCFTAFLPMGALNPRQNAKCPGCDSLERHRLLWLFLETCTNFFSEELQVLHFAPEPFFQNAFMRMPNLDYVSVDLLSPRAKIRADIACMPFRNAGFDLILCSHVLEHVPDDRRAIEELLRVLRPGGWALIQVPVNKHAEHTLEDPGIADPLERERLFGQKDHVRRYGLDFPQRLVLTGFETTVEPFAELLGAEVVKRYGLRAGEDLYVCRKVS